MNPPVTDAFGRKVWLVEEHPTRSESERRSTLLSAAFRMRQPTNPAELNLLEEAIRDEVAAGNLNRAATLYAGQMGGYAHLGWRLADYRRGLRVTGLLTDAGGVELEGQGRVSPHYESALFLLALGHPARAEKLIREVSVRLGAEAERYRHLMDVYSRGGNEAAALLEDPEAEQLLLVHRQPPEIAWLYRTLPARATLCDTLLAQGRLWEAESVASDTILARPISIWERSAARSTSSPLGRRATARALRGDVPGALTDFRACGAAAWPRSDHAITLVRLGRLKEAETLLAAEPYMHPLLAVRASLARAEIALASGDSGEARRLALGALNWSQGTGHLFTNASACLILARCCLRAEDIAGAQITLDRCLEAARSASFALLQAEALALIGRLALIEGAYDTALGHATEARELCEVTGYRWGLGATMHLMAEANLARRRYSLAKADAQAAFIIRQAIGDARVASSRALLERV